MSSSESSLTPPESSAVLLDLKSEEGEERGGTRGEWTVDDGARVQIGSKELLVQIGSHANEPKQVRCE